jgi:hypothetical protein
MMIEPSRTMFVVPPAAVSTEVCEGLLSVRNTVEMALWSDDPADEGRALVRRLDAAAGEHLMLIKMLREVGDRLRAGVNPRQVAHDIEGALRSLAPRPAPGPASEDLAEFAGEGEV